MRVHFVANIIFNKTGHWYYFKFLNSQKLQALELDLFDPERQMKGNLIVLLFFKKFDILLLQTFYIMIVLFCAHNDFIFCNFHFQYYNGFFLISLQNVVPFRDSVLTKLLKIV